MPLSPSIGVVPSRPRHRLESSPPFLRRLRISPARVFVCLVIASGYAGATVAAQQPQRPDSSRGDSLHPVLLPPVIVSVTRSPTDPGHVPFAVAVIDRNEIAHGRPLLGLSETLVTVPGIYVADRHNPSQDDNLSIRGFGARSAFGVRGIKVLLDGIPQTLPDGQGQLSNVELAGVNHIEVLRGPSSSLYGNASGGVISLSTDTAAPAAAEPTLRVEGGSYGMRKGYGALAAPLGGGSLILDGTRLVMDGSRGHDSASTWRGSARYHRRLSDRTRLTVQLLAADSPRLQDPGALTAAEADTSPAAASPRNVVADAGKSVSQEQAGLGLEHAWATGGSLALSLFGVRRDLDNATAATYIQLGRWAYGVRASATHPVALGSHVMMLTAGLDAQWQHDDRLNLTLDRVDTTRNQLEHVSEIGPFVEARMDITHAATLTLGARYDRVAFRVDDYLLADGDDSGSRLMEAPSASAGLTIDVDPLVQPYLSVSTSFDTPTTTELANRPTGPGGFNPDLQPQKAVNYEAGIRGRVPGAGDYTLSAYSADVRDELIPYEVPGDPTRRFYRNAGSARHQGIELGVTIEPLPRLRFVGAYSYTALRFVTFRTATDTLDGKHVPGVPTHYGHASVRYTWGGGVWTAVDVTTASALFADDANTVRVSGWHTVTARAGWDGRLGPWHVSPFAAVQNLLDEHYIGSVSVNAQFGRYFEPAPGRNVYLGLQVGPR
jgi:iron complex outermembrane receptor protein